MNRERARDFLPILKAFLDGKDIEVNLGGVWSSEEYEFRIKPRVIYVNYYPITGIKVFTSADLAIADNNGKDKNVAIKFIEVME